MIAYYLIGSPTFTELLTVALDRLGQPINFGAGARQNAKRVVEMVQSAIVGRMIDADTHVALTAFVEQHPQFKGATICPLGASKDSGAVQAYVSLDQPMFPRVSTLEQAAARNDPGPVLFLEDFTASGGQALDILGHWFGDSELTNETLGEERLPFTEKERSYLRARELACLWKDGKVDGVDWHAPLRRRDKK